MSQCSNPLFGEGTFFIMQHRGPDRIMFEVNAGKMVSINVEPTDQGPRQNKSLDDVATDHGQVLVHPKGHC